VGGDVNVFCDIASVSKSGYYKWLRHADEPDKDYDDYIKVKKVFDKGKGTYGWRSIKMGLKAMNHKKIQRIMKKYALVSKVRKVNPYKAITKKSIEQRLFENKLQREFLQLIPYKVFCTDITFIRFHNGFVYLSVIKDIASGEVMAWSLSVICGITLVTDTVKNLRLESYEDIMIHSDQGFQYSNVAFVEMVKELKMIQSMSRRGKCIDNAPIESFFGHMKDELDYKSCKTFEELRLVIAEYMRYYNYERNQWNRKRMTPVEYRNHLLTLSAGLQVSTK
jgi:transposase InsO family protein